MARDTAEYRAFKACTSKIITTLKGNLSIADKLFEEGLISEETYEDVSPCNLTTERTKARKIFSRVKGRIEGDTKAFGLFCSVLRQYDIKYFEDLHRKLIEERDRLECQQLEVQQAKQKECLPTYMMLLVAVTVSFMSILLGNQYNFSSPSNTLLVSSLQKYYSSLYEVDYGQYLPQSVGPTKIPFIIPHIKPVNEYHVELNFSNFLNFVQFGSRIALIGRPGAGKSTLARYVSKLWANGSALQQFDTLIHICLGKVTAPISSLQKLLKEECYGIIDDDNPELDKLLKKISDSEGERVVLLVDAFDEYQVEITKSDFIYKLIKNISLPRAAVIVTSRPRKIDATRLKSYFQEVVEVMGFRSADIDASLLRLGSPFNTIIGQYFKANPNVRKMCYLPLHMTMIIYLASLKQEALSRIDSETKIYTSFLYLTLEHYNIRHGLNTLSIDDCFNSAVENNPLCPLFRTICEIAFNATVKRQYTFSTNEIIKTSLDHNELEDLSLFTIKKESRRLGSIDVFFFSHHTFQDFMSASYLATLPVSEQQKMIQKYISFTGFQDLVWKFFFGLIGEKRSEETLFENFQYFVKNAGYRQLPSKYYVIDFYPLAYAFESGEREDKFAELLNYANITGPGNNYSLQISSHDRVNLRAMLKIATEDGELLFMKYTLKWISILELKLELQVQSDHPDSKLCGDDIKNFISLEGKKIFETYCNTTNAEIIGTCVLELEYFSHQQNVDPHYIFNVMQSTVMSDILYAQYLIVDMQENLIQSNADVREFLIFKLFGNRSRDELLLEFHPLSEAEIQFIAVWDRLKKYTSSIKDTSVTVDFTELKRFKLQQFLSDADIKGICESLRSATKLNTLDLSNNNLQAPADLIELLPFLPNLTTLDLSNNLLKHDFLDKSFQFLHSLDTLRLSGSMISENFSSNYSHLKALRYLDLSKQPLHHMDFASSGFEHLNNLQVLNLSCCLLTDEKLDEIAQALKSLTKLQTLDLSLNVIQQLPEDFVRQVNRVENVNLSHNLLHTPLPRLKLFQCQSTRQKCRIQRLDLANNFLCGSERDVRRFFRKLILLPELQYVDLTNNTIFLADTFWNASLTFTFDETESSKPKTVKLDWTTNISSKALRMYASCICQLNGFEFILYKNYCLSVFFEYQGTDSLNWPVPNELDKVNHRIKNFDLLSGIKKSELEIYAVLRDKSAYLHYRVLVNSGVELLEIQRRSKSIMLKVLTYLDLLVLTHYWKQRRLKGNKRISFRSRG